MSAAKDEDNQESLPKSLSTKPTNLLNTDEKVKLKQMMKQRLCN